MNRLSIKEYTDNRLNSGRLFAINPYLYPIPCYRTVQYPIIDGNEAKTTKKQHYISLGSPAPDFTLDAVVNGQKTKVSLSDYRGKWVVLFFYGSDFTFVWPTELAAVADRYERFLSLNTTVLAISTDSIYSHKVFTEISPSGRKINFPLLSDRTQEVSKKYGVLNREAGATYRSTVIIDPEGNVQVFYISREPVGRNIDEILRLVEAFQYNRKTNLGVPANWKPGEPGIKTGWEYVGKY